MAVIDLVIWSAQQTIEPQRTLLSYNRHMHLAVMKNEKRFRHVLDLSRLRLRDDLSDGRI